MRQITPPPTKAYIAKILNLYNDIHQKFAPMTLNSSLKHVQLGWKKKKNEEHVND